MVSERARAKHKGYKDPIWPTIEATHKNYHEVVNLILSSASMTTISPFSLCVFHSFPYLAQKLTPVFL